MKGLVYYNKAPKVAVVVAGDASRTVGLEPTLLLLSDAE